MPIIHYNNDILLFASRRNAICSNKQDINIMSWLTGDVVLHDISTQVTLNQEVTRDGETRRTSDGQRWERWRQARESDMYGGEGGDDRGQKAENESGGVREASGDNRVWLPFMLRQSMIHVTASTGGVRGAYKSMSWSTSSRERAKLGRLDSEPPLLLREWPPETGRERQGGVGGGARRDEEANRRGEGSRRAGGVTTSKDSSKERGGWGRERNREKNLPI